MLVCGNAVAAVMSDVCLCACLEAFGSTVSLWTLLAMNIGIGTLAAMVPAPGGNAAVSTVGLSSALVAIGLPREVSMAAELTNECVVTYLPAALGRVATRDLIRSDSL